jgi:hypothetical protein
MIDLYAVSIDSTLLDATTNNIQATRIDTSRNIVLLTLV